MDNLTKLRYWTFKILPLVYDDSLSYYEVLTKVAAKINELVDSNNAMPQAITNEITKQLNDSYATNISNKIDNAVNAVTENANSQIDKLANEVYAKLITAIATDEGTNTFTKDAKSGGELIFLNGIIYKVTAVMPAGTHYIIGTNIVPVDISKELKDIKETYLSSNNEHWNERSANNYNAGTYLFWKDILYIAIKDIHTNDILYADGNTQNLKQVTLASEITAHYNEMHSVDTNLQTQINDNDKNIKQLNANLTNEVNRATAKENSIDGRISNIVAQSGNDNTEIVDGRKEAEVLGKNIYSTIGDAIRKQVTDLYNISGKTKGRITSQNVSAPLNDLNTFPVNSFYEITDDAVDLISNLPVKEHCLYEVITITGHLNSYAATTSTTGVQIVTLSHPDRFIKNAKRIYVRNKNDNAFTEWLEFSDDNFMCKTVDRIASTPQAPLNDLNTFPVNTIYELTNVTPLSAMANIPSTLEKGVYDIITITGHLSTLTSSTTKLQIIIGTSASIYWRIQQSNIYGEWHELNANKNLHIDISSDITDQKKRLNYNNAVINGHNKTIDFGHYFHGTTKGIQEFPYEYTPGDMIDKVFISKSINPVIVGDRSNTYPVTIWDGTTKLMPILNGTPEEGQFTYDGTKFIINSQNTEFILNSVNESDGILLNNCTLNNLTVLHSYSSPITVIGSYANLNNVTVGYSTADNGLSLVNVPNALITNCEAIYNKNDGFNIHGYGNTVFINCRASHNFDDGISHHDTTTFFIIGGEFDHNHKGGVASPTHGCYGNISGVYTHDNEYGIYTTNPVKSHPNTLISNSIIIKNNIGVRADGYNLILHGCTCENNTTENVMSNGGSVTVL